MMLELDLHFEDGTRRIVRTAAPALIGRGEHCAVRVRHWRVGREHARIRVAEADIMIDDLGTLLGTMVNGRRIVNFGPLGADDEVLIGPCLMRVRWQGAHQRGDAVDAACMFMPTASDQQTGAPKCGHRQDFDARSAAPADAALVSDEGSISTIGRDATTRFIAGAGASVAGYIPDGSRYMPTAPRVDGTAVNETMEAGAAAAASTGPGTGTGTGLCAAVGTQAGSTRRPPPDTACLQPSSAAWDREPGGFAVESSMPGSQQCANAIPPGPTLTAHAALPYRRRLHAALLDALDLRRRDVASMSDALLRSEAHRLLAALVEQDQGLPPDLDRAGLLDAVLDEAVGFGPLSPLLADPGITEVMVNRHDEIYVERAGRLQRHDSAFSSEAAVMGVIERIVAPLGRRIDESSPMVDARLPDGSRVNAVVPPVALKGASVTIRKFPRHALQMADLVNLGSLDRAMAAFLEICVRQRSNIVVSGGTGSGKTTLLNILAHAIPHGERIVTIEDAAELRLRHPHLVGLEARPANLEGRGLVTIRDLVRNALRMRPDRIIVGECRGAEAFDMLAAMNTGHEGSLTTLHANTPRDALARLETMILMAGMALPLAAIREHIASSIHMIVQQARLPDGMRRIIAVVEITGMESGCIQTQTLFEYQPADGGSFRGCGALPMSAARWRAWGCPLEPTMFSGETPAPAPPREAR